MKILDVVAFAAIGGAAYFLGHRDGKISGVDEARLATAKARSDSGFAWAVRRERTTRQSVIVNRQLTIDSTQRESDKAAADSIALRVAVADSAVRGTISGADSLKRFVEIAIMQRIEIAKLRSALDGAIREVLLLQKDRNEWQQLANEAAPVILGLQHSLAAEISAHECRVLVVRCPSRATVFVGGLAIGTIVAAATLH